mmetsp:Transcript_3352/g.10171  ORF Transcript_3352/g.10171 Transcript_3352/m.10171 type:complete len:273 (-) Transcript_3352:192-1010(-)
MSALSAKPSDEEIARRRAAKNAQKQAAPKKAPPAAAPPKKKARDPEAEAAALKESAVGALVDVGANLQSRGKYDDVARQLRRAALAGVSRVVLTGCDVAGADAGRACCERWAAADEPSGLKLAFTAGVHPHDAKDWTGETSDAIEALAAHPACVSLGECGLDYDRMFSPRDVQLDVFAKQCALAVKLGRALFAHVREVDAEKGAPLGAYADAVRVLSEAGVDPRRVCVHCFTGGEAELAAVRASAAPGGTLATDVPPIRPRRRPRRRVSRRS